MSTLRRVQLPRSPGPDDIARAFEQMQSAVRAALPKAPTILERVQLTTGKLNVVAHKLGQPLRTWKVVRKRGAAEIIDYQDANPSPRETLWLFTDADVMVDLEVG